MADSNPELRREQVNEPTRADDERDLAILLDLEKGWPVSLIMERHSVSREHVRTLFMEAF